MQFKKKDMFSIPDQVKTSLVYQLTQVAREANVYLYTESEATALCLGCVLSGEEAKTKELTPCIIYYTQGHLGYCPVEKKNRNQLKGALLVACESRALRVEQPVFTVVQSTDGLVKPREHWELAGFGTGDSRSSTHYSLVALNIDKAFGKKCLAGWSERKRSQTPIAKD
jgi:hypothetical protein